MNVQCMFAGSLRLYIIFFTHCLQESLLDRQDFLHWLLDLLDKSKNADDLLLKFLIPLLLRVKLISDTYCTTYNVEIL